MAAEIRSEVRMSCSVLYDPQFELTVLWKKDNVDVDLGAAGGRISVDEDNSLVIRDLDFDDSGRKRKLIDSKSGNPCLGPFT